MSGGREETNLGIIIRNCIETGLGKNLSPCKRKKFGLPARQFIAEFLNNKLAVGTFKLFPRNWNTKVPPKRINLIEIKNIADRILGITIRRHREKNSGFLLIDKLTRSLRKEVQNVAQTMSIRDRCFSDEN